MMMVSDEARDALENRFAAYLWSKAESPRKIVAVIAPDLYQPGYLYSSKLVSAAPSERFFAMGFVADGQGPARIRLKLEQARDDMGTDCKTVYSRPPRWSLPERRGGADGSTPVFIGSLSMAGEDDLDRANGYGFVRCTVDVLVDSVFAGALLFCVGPSIAKPHYLPRAPSQAPKVENMITIPERDVNVTRASRRTFVEKRDESGRIFSTRTEEV